MGLRRQRLPQGPVDGGPDEDDPVSEEEKKKEWRKIGVGPEGIEEGNGDGYGEIHDVPRPQPLRTPDVPTEV